MHLVPDILKTIQREYSGLSPQLQVAARYILSSPDEVAVYSMREIANRASVTPATMVRLAGKLGFLHYNDLRNRFRVRISESASGYAARARKLQLRQGSRTAKGLSGEILRAELDNLTRTFENFTDEMLENAAGALISAKAVHVIGLRKCTGVASFFHYATRVFFPTARQIMGRAGLFSEELMKIEKGDVLVSVAFDPYTRETVEAVRYATSVGATNIAITDSPVSPLARNADFLFVVANSSPSFYRSLSGALVTLQALVAAVVTQLGEPAVAALEQSDNKLRHANTYWKG